MVLKGIEVEHLASESDALRAIPQWLIISGAERGLACLSSRRGLSQRGGAAVAHQGQPGLDSSSCRDSGRVRSGPLTEGHLPASALWDCGEEPSSRDSIVVMPPYRGACIRGCLTWSRELFATRRFFASFACCNGGTA